MFAFALMRILLGAAIGVWFPAAQQWDDRLMIGYTALKAHFSIPVYYSLVKDMSFPVFLKLTSASHIPYSAILAILWVTAALSIYTLIKRICCNSKYCNIIAFFCYIYCLFLPQAFDIWSGTRLYRNPLISPLVIIIFSLIIRMVYDLDFGNRFIYSILLGLLFSFTYYIKEDGLWLLACLVFATLVSLVRNLYIRQFSVKSLIVLILPVFIFIASSLGYRTINYLSFGVFEINTRTGGEFGSFMEHLYEIESDNRSIVVWTPADTFQKAYDSSSTLAKHPELLDEIMHSPWAQYDLYANPLAGDHLAWALRDALLDTGLYTSERDVQEFFRTVNNELDEAFKSGTLHRDKETHQLLPSTGGYTSSEIANLFTNVADSFLGAIILKGYRPGLGNVSEEEISAYQTECDMAASVTNERYVSNIDLFNNKHASSDRLIPCLTFLAWIYRVINVVLFVLSLVLMFLFIIRALSHYQSHKHIAKNNLKPYMFVIGSAAMLGISICYAFSISWFSAFLFEDGIDMTILNFYNIALPGLLMYMNILSLLGVSSLHKAS